MSLADQVDALATRIATEINSVRDEMAGGGSGGGASWTEIASAAANATAITFSSIPDDYEDLLMVAESVGHNQTTGYMYLMVSPNGSSWSPGGQVLSYGSTHRASGSIYFPNRKHNYGGMFPGVVNALAASWSSPFDAQVGSGSHMSYLVTGGIKAIRMSSVLGTFNAGTFRLFGR